MKNYSGMYNNVDVNLLQYVFEWDPTKTTKNSYPDLGLSEQKIHEA